MWQDVPRLSYVFPASDLCSAVCLRGLASFRWDLVLEIAVWVLGIFFFATTSVIISRLLQGSEPGSVCLWFCVCVFLKGKQHHMLILIFSIRDDIAFLFNLITLRSGSPVIHTESPDFQWTDLSSALSYVPTELSTAMPTLLLTVWLLKTDFCFCFNLAIIFVLGVYPTRNA